MVLKNTHLKLDRLGLESLENLECYDRTTHAYFQYNNLRELSDQFSFMPNLIFLVAFNNKIESVNDELLNCTKLEVLDLSNNQINKIQLENLPKSLLVLNLKGNPISQDSEFLDQCLSCLPNLIELNEVLVTSEMRARNKFCLFNETTSNQDKDCNSDLEYGMSQSFESFTVEKLRSLPPKDGSILEYSRKYNKHPQIIYSNKERFPLTNVSFVRPDSEEIEQLEKSRSHNTLTFEQLLIEQKQLHIQRQQMLIEEMEQARLEFKKKHDQLLQESRKRREGYKQTNETTKAEVTNS
jgi:Leucine-rich repeat (LRR) protein